MVPLILGVAADVKVIAGVSDEGADGGYHPSWILGTVGLLSALKASQL